MSRFTNLLMDGSPQHMTMETTTPDKHTELTALVTPLHRPHRPQSRSIHTNDRVAVSLYVTCGRSSSDGASKPMPGGKELRPEAPMVYSRIRRCITKNKLIRPVFVNAYVLALQNLIQTYIRYVCSSDPLPGGKIRDNVTTYDRRGSERSAAD